MELRHLRYFVQLAHDLHFARAAEHLGISQPPLSQQIRALEEELGVRLFDRTSRRVALTQAGRLFLDPARATLAQAAHAVRVARRAALGELGTLEIGFSASAPFVPRATRAIHDFRSAYPEIALAMTEMAPPEQIDAIAEGLIDIGFARSGAPLDLPDAVTATLLQRERLYVAVAPGHPLAARAALRLADLAGQPMLVYSAERGGGFTADLFAMLRAAGVEPVVAQAVHEVSTLLGLAAAGLGLAVLSQSLCALQSAGLVYLPLADEAATAAMWLLHRRAGASLPCRHFVEIVARAGTADQADRPA